MIFLLQSSRLHTGFLDLVEVLHLLASRLRQSRHPKSELPFLERLTLRYFELEFTPQLVDAIEALLGRNYDVVQVDLKKKCEEVIRRGIAGDLVTKLELIDC